MSKESKELITQKDADAMSAWREDFDVKEDAKQIVDAKVPRITIVRESRQFRFDDDRYAATFESIPTAFFRTRSFWETSMEDAGGETTRPDCFSSDGIRPNANVSAKQSETCVACPKNKFGTAKGGSGKGKACKERGHLVVLDPEAAIPFPAELAIPVTSLATVNNFLMRCTKDNAPLVSRVVKFSLEKRKESSGFENAILKMDPIGTTDARLIPVLKALRDQMSNIKARIAGGNTEAVEAEHAGVGVETGDDKEVPF